MGDLQMLPELVVLFLIVGLIYLIYRQKKKVKTPLPRMTDSSKQGLPIGYKIIGWFWLIGPLLIAIEYWTKPDAGENWIRNGLLSLIALVFIVSAWTMLKGKKIGVLILSILLILSGLGTIFSGHIGHRNIDYQLIGITLLFFIAPALYLLYHYKKFLGLNNR